MVKGAIRPERAKNGQWTDEGSTMAVAGERRGVVPEAE